MPFIKTLDTRPKTFHVHFTAEIQPPSSVAEANLAASDDSVFLATGCQATDTQFNNTRITHSHKDTLFLPIIILFVIKNYNDYKNNHNMAGQYTA